MAIMVVSISIAEVYGYAIRQVELRLLELRFGRIDLLLALFDSRLWLADLLWDDAGPSPPVRAPLARWR
jgi:hypothetical protein